MILRAPNVKHKFYAHQITQGDALFSAFPRAGMRVGRRLLSGRMPAGGTLRPVRSASPSNALPTVASQRSSPAQELPLGEGRGQVPEAMYAARM